MEQGWGVLANDYTERKESLTEPMLQASRMAFLNSCGDGLKVKKNGGRAGFTGWTIEQFEERLKEISTSWNRSLRIIFRSGPRGGDTKKG